MKDPKQNISILCTSLASGGAEKVISLLLKKLINDFDVTLVLFYDQIHFPIPDEVRTVFLKDKNPPSSHIKKITDFFIFMRRYKRLIKNKNIAISISFLAFPNLVNGVMALLNKHLKTIISERGFPSDNTSSKISFYISKVFYPMFYNKCDRLFSNSVHINKDLKENFGIRIPMEVIYNPIEIPRNTVNPNDLILENHKLKVVTAGTLIKRKNHVMVLEAIQKSELDYEFSIYGGGELHDYLQQKIVEYQLENSVILKGKVKDVNRRLLENQCFVLSSFTEGFPNALIEAMAIGLPCISTNCLSGPLELLNENEEINIADGTFYKAKYGLLVNNDDAIGLCKALDYFHRNERERRKYHLLSLQRSKEYQLDGIYKKFYKFIQK